MQKLIEDYKTPRLPPQAIGSESFQQNCARKGHDVSRFFYNHDSAFFTLSTMIAFLGLGIDLFGSAGAYRDRAGVIAMATFINFATRINKKGAIYQLVSILV